MSKETTLKVLRKAADDDGFLAQLADNATQALKNYDLTWEEKAALSSGGVRWIEKHVGKLDKDLMTWIKCRLEQEKW
ncbi:hypothetical protein ACFL9U_00745 [Thermodesulfobacteriota bacterium]